ncbi:MAG: ParB N-terminal domain-containing protein [Desulfobacteraceae bacterium]|jgi:ParB-like chromosome segregation protein Spo0J
MFEENMRDGIKFDPIHFQAHPDEPGKYRILDGAHRFQGYKGIGEKDVKAEIINLNGEDPLLYAASKAIGPRELKDDEARETARRAYKNNPKLTSKKIGARICRSRRTVDSYISDLRAASQFDLSLKILRMSRLGVPQERIAQRFGLDQKTISNYSGKKATLPFLLNTDLKQGFTVSQVAEKHGCP